LNHSFWAKKNEYAGRMEWLPLSFHLKDTMTSSGFLWEHWLCEGQKVFLRESMDCGEEEAKKVVCFLGAIHDIGKATPAFQKQKGYRNSPDLDQTLLEHLERDGFCGLMEKYLASPNKSHHSLAGQVILHQYGFNEDVCSIVGAHHGKPIDSESSYGDQIEAYTSNYYQTDKESDSIGEKWKKAQEQVILWAMKENDFSNINEIPSITQAGQVILSGLLIMADWIASNERYFPLLSIDDEIENYPEERAEGLEKWYKNEPWEADRVFDVDQIFLRRFGFKPRSFQRTIFETVSKCKSPGIFIIEAPMGGGKTEAALVAAEQLAYKMRRSGLLFALPTQATTNGIFSRVEEWSLTISNEKKSRISIQLLHGKAALNEDYNKLTKSQNIDIDNECGLFVNEWFVGRKTASLDDFVVAAVDSVLLLALKQKHLALRHLGLSKKVVIIDEVHAYDAYMCRYLFRAIEWLGKYHVPVVVLSATLPADTRIELVTSYLKGQGIKKKAMSMDKKAISSDAYPLLTFSNGNEICTFDTFERGENRQVEIKCIENEDLLYYLNRAVSDGACVGIIVNTVRKAQKLATLCIKTYGNEAVELLHSAFVDEERFCKEGNLVNMVGKGAKRPRYKIIIGTQVMEQSLDIDFDLLISDLCPMDLLLQRVGRLHRHEIRRPKGYEQARLLVLGTSKKFEFEEGSLAVYGAYYLIRTQYFLPSILQLPSDISLLVQKVYSKKELNLEEESLKQIYDSSKDKTENLIAKKENKADFFRIKEPYNGKRKEKENLIGWLKNPKNSESEEAAYAQVRDIDETIEVIALKKIGQGYGFFGESEDISRQLDDIKTVRRIAKQTIRINHSSILKVGIDKLITLLEGYNKTNLPNWQEILWLKGSLGLIFNENHEFEIDKLYLRYDLELGLITRKEE